MINTDQKSSVQGPISMRAIILGVICLFGSNIAISIISSCLIFDLTFWITGSIRTLGFTAFTDSIFVVGLISMISFAMSLGTSSIISGYMIGTFSKNRVNDHCWIVGIITTGILAFIFLIMLASTPEVNSSARDFFISAISFLVMVALLFSCTLLGGYFYEQRNPVENADKKLVEEYLDRK